jgi:hypothetical protein
LSCGPERGRSRRAGRGGTLDADFPAKVALISPEPTNAFFSLDVPKLAAEPAPTLKPIALHQYDSVWIDVGVNDPSKVVSVEAGQLTLRSRPLPPDKQGKPAKALQVEVTRRLTAKPGDVDITLLDKDRKKVGSVRLHIAPQHDEEKGEE